MNDQIDINRFKKDEERVKQKIESVENIINEDLSLIPEYQILLVYNKINKIITQEEKKFSILKNKFLFKDKTLTGYINLKDFYDILNNNLSLERDELKILLCDPILRNKINPNLYQYKPFLNRISDFNENEITKMRREYNVYQNKYITDLRNSIKIKKFDIKNLWDNTYPDGAKCLKNNFYLLFNGIKSNYSFHFLEIEYIFDLICKKGEDSIKFEDFKDVMDKSRGEDLRVLFFRRLKEQKEKEKKKEEEKMLINYYPNMMDNNMNNDINFNINNDDGKANFIILKGEQIINNEMPQNIHNNENKSDEQNNNIINNKNEQFILGNNNFDNRTNNLENMNDEKPLKQIVEKFEITQSIVGKDKIPDNDTKENINTNEKNEKDQNIPQTKVKLKKYNKTIYDIENNLLSKSTILKDKSYFEELKKSSIQDIDDLIQKRINNSNEKVNNVLNQHEEYIILKLYLSLHYQIALLDSDILTTFQKKDSQNKRYLSFNDFKSILQTDLKLRFNQNELEILLNSLEDIDISNKLYSYEEFIKNVKNFSFNNKDKINQIERFALINYNLYLIDFKRYINNKNIDINNIFNAVSSNKVSLTLNEFISFCNCFQYKLSNFNEYKYIFDIITKDPKKKYLSKSDMIVFAHSDIIPEEKFIEDGKCQKNLGKNINKNWHKYIPKYSLSNESNNFKSMKHFEKLFSIINKQQIKFGINNFEDLFSSECDVDINGNIYKEEFINALSIIEIKNQPIINELLFFLEDIYDSNKFQLANFLGIFEVFYPQEEKISKPPYNYNTYPRNPKIVFKNNYGFFLPEDIKQIKIICSNIYEIIYYIKTQTINNYFKKFDYYKKGYFTLKQLKYILLYDLEINKYELIDLFLSYILDNEKKNDFYVIKIKRLIEVLAEYVGIKVDEEEQNLSKTFYYTDDIKNKLLNSTIMNIRLNEKQGSTYIYSPNAGIY